MPGTLENTPPATSASGHSFRTAERCLSQRSLQGTCQGRGVACVAEAEYLRLGDVEGREAPRVPVVGGYKHEWERSQGGQAARV